MLIGARASGYARALFFLASAAFTNALNFSGFSCLTVRFVAIKNRNSAVLGWRIAFSWLNVGARARVGLALCFSKQHG
jgi:hypothetical protein